MSYPTSVNYYRVNANNNVVATSNSGADGTPTEEITMPVSGGGYASGYGITTITGQTLPASTFQNFSPGQYLYFTDSTTGNYVLLGQIDTIDSASSPQTITLTSLVTATSVPIAGDVLSASFALITNNEPFFIRLATETINATQKNIPDFATWRVNANPNSTNTTTYSRLEQVSAQGTPLVPQSAVNIPFRFVTMNIFTQGATSSVRWNNSESLPSYIWIKVTPQLSATNSQLASKTMYRFTTEESIPALIVGVGTANTVLSAAGYSNVDSATTGGNNNQA